MTDMNDRYKPRQVLLPRLRSSFLLPVAIGMLLIAASAEGADLQVLSRDGTPRGDLPSLELNATAYISALDLAHLLSASHYWSPEKKKMDIRFGGHLLTLTAFNPVIILNREAFHLPTEIVFRSGCLWVPLKALSAVLERAAPGWLAWKPETGQIQLLSPGFNIHHIRIDSKSNGTLITIPASQAFSLEHSLGPSNWLTITVLDGRIDLANFDRPLDDTLVTGLKAYQFGESCQISLQLAPAVQTYTVYQEEDPPAIIVLLRHSHGSPPASRAPSPDELRPNKELALFDLVVLDPGHGGQDPGAIGPSGLQEKEVVLDITQRLGELLQSQLGMKVILTRDDDAYVSLQRRTEIANSTGADLFISIHANASRKRSVGGSETFFLSPAKNDEARAVAMLENSALKFDEELGSSAEGLSEEDFILRDIVSDMLQSSFLKESEDLAAHIQAELEKKLDLRNRGVDQAGFFVLVGAKMPAVLIEIAFLSNQYEEKLLKQRWFRQHVAEGIFNGISRFKAKYESKL